MRTSQASSAGNSGPFQRQTKKAPEITLRGLFLSGPPRPDRDAADIGLDQNTLPLARTASSSRATMLVILIIGFTAGPEVSL